MHRTTTALFSAVLLSAAALAHAEPAIYQDGVLTVPQGAIISDSREVYYTNIQMRTDADGKLVIVGATRMPLAFVEAVEAVIAVDENSSTVELEVSGSTSTPCVSLLEPAIAAQDEGFVVLLAETQTTASCAQVTEPFTTRISLDFSDFEPGTYFVRVNDVEIGVELPEALSH